MDVSIVSGTYNRKDLLIEMIDSARRSAGVGLDYEFIIVDGGSTDGTLTWCRKQEDVILIEQGELLGAVKAFNAGCEVSAGLYVILANDDIEFLYEGIQAGFAFMQDNPHIGIGCFAQNRYNDDYTVAEMPVVIKGKKASKYYGQICMVPRWLGDKVGWWGNYLHTYGGDNELSCNVYELGYTVEPIPYACINDKVCADELREINNPNGKKGHPDSIAWVKKWTDNKDRLGPHVIDIPTVKNPIGTNIRMVYAPIYEQKYAAIQKKSKYGLRDALKLNFSVTEVDYRKSIEDLWYTSLLFRPHVFLFQFQDASEESVQVLKALKGEFPDATFVNWNGDYGQSLYSPRYQRILEMFDLITFVSGDVVNYYRQRSLNSMYWQVSFEEHEWLEPYPDTYDIIFQGSGYTSARIELGYFLRSLPFKTGLFGTWRRKVKADGFTLYDFAKGAQLYRSGKIAISDNQYKTSIAYVSNRLFQVLHAGTFLLQEQIPEVEKYMGFVDGKHFVQWDGLDDLKRKIIYWLDHPEEREIIAKAGQDFVHKYHSFHSRVKQLVKMLPKEL